MEHDHPRLPAAVANRLEAHRRRQPRLRERWDATVHALADRARNIHAARQAIRDLLGDRVTVRNENGDLFAEIAASDCQLKLVAGAGVGLYLTEPLRLPLGRTRAVKHSASDDAAQ